MPIVDGALAQMEVCSVECLEKLIDKLEQEEQAEPEPVNE
jgi:hypothetical protein